MHLTNSTWALVVAALLAGLLTAPSATVAANETEQDEIKTNWIAPDAESVRPLRAGNSIPDVTLRTVDGEPVRLREVVARKPTMLVFYRGGWCVYCNMQLGQLQAAHAQFEEMGYQLVGISPDRPEKLAESIENHELNYTLLSDAEAAGIQAFGLAFQVDAETVTALAGYGIDLEEASGQPHHVLPVPAVYLVAPDGAVQFAHVDPDYSQRPAIEALLEVARTATE